MMPQKKKISKKAVRTLKPTYLVGFKRNWSIDIYELTPSINVTQNTFGCDLFNLLRLMRQVNVQKWRHANLIQYLTPFVKLN